MSGSVRSVRYLGLRRGIGVMSWTWPVVQWNLGDFASARAIDNVRIERVGSDIAVLDHAHGMPVAEGDGAVVAAAGDADGTAFLLPGTNPIGERVVGDRVVKLRRRLVVPGTPSVAAVHGDNCTLIADQKNNAAVVGIDPEVLIVVAAGRAAKAGPRLAAVGGAHGDGAGHINDVGILGINPGKRQIAAADAASGTRIIGDLGPTLTRVVRAVDAEFPRGLGESCVKSMRIAGSDGHVDLRKILGQTVLQSMPGAAAVGGFEEAATRTVKLVVVLPRTFAHFPHRSVDDIRIRGIDLDVGAARVLVLGNNSLPGLTAVGGAIDTAFFTGSVGVAEHRGKNPVGVARIDRECGDLLSVDAGRDESRSCRRPWTCRCRCRPRDRGDAIPRHWQRRRCWDRRQPRRWRRWTAWVR